MWSDWDQDFSTAFESCVDVQTVTRYACPVAINDKCTSEVRTRSRGSGETTWGEWDGDFEYVQCIQVQTRERVDYASTCLSETQTRSRSCLGDGKPQDSRRDLGCILPKPQR